MNTEFQYGEAFKTISLAAMSFDKRLAFGNDDFQRPDQLVHVTRMNP